MNVLIVKLSSLGDIVHTMPAVQDLRAARPEARIHWVAEEGFAELARGCEGVERVIPIALRRWRREGLWRSGPRREWRAFVDALRACRYDRVVDVQGLIKSALVTRLAALAPGGLRVGLGNRTEGSSYEPLARLAYDRAPRIEPRVHAVERSRRLLAACFGYALDDAPPRFGLRAAPEARAELNTALALPPRYAVLVHASSRADKLWPAQHWAALAPTLRGMGLAMVLPWGSAAEREAAVRLASAIGSDALVPPRLGLPAVTALLEGADIVVGVDSGLVHMACAVNRPVLQIYNHDTAWRTGSYRRTHQLNVVSDAPPRPPPVAAVEQALQALAGAAAWPAR
jgi:heptosyltransferase-1